MKLIDRIKQDIKTYNNIKDKEGKFYFIWDYYKIPIILAFLAVILVISLIVNGILHKPTILNVVLLNNDADVVQVDNSYFQKSLQKSGVEIENKNIEVVTYLSYGMAGKESQDGETLQVLNALFVMNEMDIFVADKERFDMFKGQDAYCDLSQLVDKTLLEKHNDKLYWYDDSAGQKIVGGIILNNDSSLHQAGYYHNEVIAGIAANSTNFENAVKIIEQLLNE